MTGTITRVVHDRGFGFIRDTSGISRFFQVKDIAYDFDHLREGMVVEFEPATGPQHKGNGLRATKVMVMES